MSNPTLSNGTTTLTLWNAQTDSVNADGQVGVNQPPTFTSDEALLSGLEIDEEIALNGTTTGPRLTNQPGYSDDPVLAVAEWVQTFLAFVNGQQGSGLTLSSTERNRDVTGVVTSAGWTRRGASSVEVNWDLTIRRGEGLMVSSSLSPNTASPQSTATLDGVELPYPSSWRERKRQDVEIAPMTYADSPAENLIKDNSGAKRRLTIVGRATGTASERNSFDHSMRALIGQDKIVPYQSAFPGHTLDVMVTNYESARQAGWTRLGEYSLELVEGIRG